MTLVFVSTLTSALEKRPRSVRRMRSFYLAEQPVPGHALILNPLHVVSPAAWDASVRLGSSGTTRLRSVLRWINVPLNNVSAKTKSTIFVSLRASHHVTTLARSAPKSAPVGACALPVCCATTATASV